MRLTESINNSFKLSDFLEVYEEISTKNVYLQSYISHKKKLVSKKNYRLLQRKLFHSVDKELLKELILNDILIPDIINEKENLINYLQNLNKVTIVFGDYHFSDSIFQEILNILDKNTFNDICLLFTCQNKNNIEFIRQELPKYSKALENVSILRLENTDIDSYNQKINIYKSLNSFAEENQIYSHTLVHNINNFVTEGISISEEKISFKEINSNILNAYHDKLAKPKNMQSLSLSASNHHYLKELPITGFIVDYDIILDFIKNRKLNEQCIACSILPLCGGYLKNAQVECPSFKNIPLSIFSKEKEEVPHIALTGVSNSLTLKLEILECFEKMISLNVRNPLDYMAIVYLNKEYSRGFIHAKSGKIVEAAYTFKSADILAKKLLSNNGFSYNYVQTFITSTKSYLAFKTNKKEEAINITLKGILYGIKLNKYISSEIISLHISQMLMNMSKVYLSLDDVKNWERITLANINYLLNHELPEEASHYDITLLQKVTDNLKYFMLLEAISQVLNIIIKNDFKPGIELLHKIYVKDLSKNINKQINEWVSLIKICFDKRVDIMDFKEKNSEFMNSKNEIIDLTKLKFFLRFCIKKY